MSCACPRATFVMSPSCHGCAPKKFGVSFNHGQCHSMWSKLRKDEIQGQGEATRKGCGPKRAVDDCGAAFGVICKEAFYVRHRVSKVPAGPQSPPSPLLIPSVLSAPTRIPSPSHLVESAISLLSKVVLEYWQPCLAAKPKGSRPSCPTYARNEPDELKTDSPFLFSSSRSAYVARLSYMLVMCILEGCAFRC